MSLRWTEEQYNDYLNGGASPPQEGPAKVRREIIPDESVEQRALVRWLELKGILFTHVPNGGKRHVAVAKKLKAEGVKPGVPDILIFDRPPAHPSYVGVAIEMQRKKRGQVSEHQQNWLRWLDFRGWKTAVCNGADDAIRRLEELGY